MTSTDNKSRDNPVALADHSIFAAAALVLASVELFGVVSYSVKHRTRKIRIGIAVGGRHGNVIRLVLGHALKLSEGGVFLGLATSLLATRWLATRFTAPELLIRFLRGSRGAPARPHGLCVLSAARRAAPTEPREALAEG